jgi:small conductance mechanosensitive channel
LDGELSTLEKMLQSFVDWSLTTGGKLLSAALVLLIGIWLTKLLCKFIRKILEKSKIDTGAAGFIVSVLKVVCWILIALTAIGKIVNVSSLVAALGAAGLTASFALQGSLSNFISGMQVIFSHPFSVGDYLSVDGCEGTVSHIDVLNTTLHTIDNKEVIIPNSKITSCVVTNYSAQPTRRIDLSYDVSYTTDLNLAKKVISGLAAADGRILTDPEPLIAVGAHKDSSIEIIAKLWVNTADYWSVYYDMQEKVKNAFDENGISIPFPQLDVHTK